MSELVSLRREGEIALVTVDNPPVNALSPGVPQGLEHAIAKCRQDPAVKAIVLIGAGRTFIAGADIREFAKIRSGEKQRGEGLHPLLFTLEDCPKPIVAAIHGTAFGGGLEVAMACHHRVAVASAQVGQPEIKLGIIPGAGGTLRLPRLAGVEKAVEMCALGEPISAPEALRYGIIDRIVDGESRAELEAGALAFARELIAAGFPPRKVRELDDKLGDEAANAPIFAAIREKVRRKRRGEIAPLRSIDSVEAATRMSFEDARAKTAELFRECLMSEQSEALMYVFFGEREVRKIPDIPADTPTLPIRKAAVVGAGTMGAGITMAYLNAGIPVILKERSQEDLDRGLASIRANYARSIQRGRFPQRFVDQRLALLTPALDYNDFGGVDIVIEAVFENMQLKKEVFAELDKVTKSEAVLASNTSTLDIDEIASGTSRPESVVGNHFFSPANIMRLVEVVRGEATSKQILATSMSLARCLGKVAVLVGNCRGFVGNRMFLPYVREAQFLVEEGAAIRDVDQALEGFGMAMGPLATGDLAGIDVGWRIHQEHKHLDPEGVRHPLVEARLYEMGRYGQKTRAGWYRYDENRRRADDPEVEAMVAETARHAGISRRRIESAEIVERTIYALVNEGAKILEEGYALRPVDIDIIYFNGYGFPAYRGGPMWYADQVGLHKVHERVTEFERQHGYWWRPAPLLTRLAQEGKTFAQWNEERRAGASTAV